MSTHVAAPPQPKSTRPQALGRVAGDFWARFLNRFDLWAGRWIQYIYFLRFSILLWCFPLLLVALNSPSAGRTLVSGILTPVTPLQYLCASFFLISASVVALIMAHVVVINGKERFGDDPPQLLSRLLADQNPRWEWVAPVASQLNNVLVFWYFFSNGAVEQVDARYIRSGLLWGALVAGIFWYGISAIYYLIYRPGRGALPTQAKTLIFPRALLGLSGPAAQPGFGSVLERASLPFSFGWISMAFPVAGFRWQVPELNPDQTPRIGADGKPVMKAAYLYEGHFFSLVAAAGFYALYLVLWPMTAPVLIPGAGLAIAAYCAGSVVLFFSVLAARPAEGDRGKLRLWKAILGVLIFGFACALPVLYYRSDPERFPILASVLILVTAASWTLGGIAFLVDRYRIPVLTVFVAVLVLPRMIPGPGGKPLTGAQEEHYLSYSSVPAAAVLPTPGEVLDARLRQEYCGGQPCAELPADAHPAVVVVTSTGGGIHAAAWTTAVLGQLEKQFGGSFHQHVLLLSTVSGGSVGLYDYLRELDPETNGGSPDWKRMTLGARCSSLEAVGWGLIYYDVPKAVIPFIPYFVSPSSGGGDLRHQPLGKDRTWSLRRAMARNLNDRYCAQWAYTADAAAGTPAPRPDDPQIRRSEVSADQQAAPDNDQRLTLSRLSPVAGSSPFPAFTMNTTTVEGGNRLLLSNYFIKRGDSGDPLVSKPAYSFLNLYGSVPAEDGGFVDLPLATAAQLSATFPYVSSAATLKVAPKPDGAHFVDGGYFDNDGTVSAIEFLRYALEESKLVGPGSGAAGGGGGNRGAQSRAAGHTLRVLLVEIRNSPDGTGNAPLVSEPNQGKPWNVLSQIVAPLEGFWSAGHASITGRNRNALGLLEGAFHNNMAVQHFVIDDQTTTHPNPPCVPTGAQATDPLNWSLTPCQQVEVDFAANEDYNTTKYKNVHACFVDGDSPLCPPRNKEEQPQ